MEKPTRTYSNYDLYSTIAIRLESFIFVNRKPRGASPKPETRSRKPNWHSKRSGGKRSAAKSIGARSRRSRQVDSHPAVAHHAQGFFLATQTIVGLSQGCFREHIVRLTGTKKRGKQRWFFNRFGRRRVAFARKSFVELPLCMAKKQHHPQTVIFLS